MHSFIVSVNKKVFIITYIKVYSKYLDFSTFLWLNSLKLECGVIFEQCLAKDWSFLEGKYRIVQFH